MKSLGTACLLFSFLFSFQRGAGGPVSKPKTGGFPIQIMSDKNELMVSIDRNGLVTYGPSFKLDETAKVFWEALAYEKIKPCGIPVKTVKTNGQ